MSTTQKLGEAVCWFKGWFGHYFYSWIRPTELQVCALGKYTSFPLPSPHSYSQKLHKNNSSDSLLSITREGGKGPACKGPACSTNLPIIMRADVGRGMKFPHHIQPHSTGFKKFPPSSFWDQIWNRHCSDKTVPNIFQPWKILACQMACTLQVWRWKAG